MSKVLIKTINLPTHELDVKRDIDILGFHCVCARRASGKTNFLVQLLSKLSKKIDILIVIGGTQQSVDVLGRFSHPSFTMSGWDEKRVQNIVDTQELKKAKGSWMPTIMMVMDDVAFDLSWRNSATMRRLSFAGRHSRIGVILTTQRLKSISPNLRSNISTLTLFATTDKEEREAFYSHASGMSKVKFYALLDLATKDFATLTLLQDVQGMASVRRAQFQYRPNLEFTCLSEPVLRAIDKQLKSEREYEREKITQLEKRMQLNENVDSRGKPVKVVTAYQLELLR
tara:strand:+ start:113 stop:967 length:855 start_codon:yes stop_codon:yes gene_type:complete